MPRAPLPLARILASDATLATWDARARREAVLTALIRRQLPRPLAQRVHVANGEGNELELAVDAGAIAGIIRQRAPDLIAHLRREGWEFTGIRLRVQVRVVAAKQEKIPINQPDKEALRPLATLGATLPAGPLKSALARLLRRIGG